jgi:tRNA pseudouridine38/39 synthase
MEIRSESLKPRETQFYTGSTGDPIDLNDPDYQDQLNFDPILDEIPYCTTLNRLLPPDIRILAWCPNPPQEFSARFSCRERQYRYFFTQPAFHPPPEPVGSEAQGRNSKVKDGWLDIEAMREAASYFRGEHDFRNFCKVDGSKQLTSWTRDIFLADVVEVEPSQHPAFINDALFKPANAGEVVPKVYAFQLHGSAFLWHQVRCMVAVLFLVGQGLEPPTIIKDLLDVEKCPGRPAYEMASDTPLVLWDCIFPREKDPERKDALDWVYVGEEATRGAEKWGQPSLIEDLWKVWRERKIDEVLAGNLLDMVARQGHNPVETQVKDTWQRKMTSQRVFDGGNKARLTGKYQRVMEKEKMDTPEVTNMKYAKRKGLDYEAKLQRHRENSPPYRRFVGAIDEKVVEERE